MEKRAEKRVERYRCTVYKYVYKIWYENGKKVRNIDPFLMKELGFKADNIGRNDAWDASTLKKAIETFREGVEEKNSKFEFKRSAGFYNVECLCMTSELKQIHDYVNGGSHYFLEPATQNEKCFFELGEIPLFEEERCLVVEHVLQLVPEEMRKALPKGLIEKKQVKA